MPSSISNTYICLLTYLLFINTYTCLLTYLTHKHALLQITGLPIFIDLYVPAFARTMLQTTEPARAAAGAFSKIDFKAGMVYVKPDIDICDTSDQCNRASQECRQSARRNGWYVHMYIYIYTSLACMFNIYTYIHMRSKNAARVRGRTAGMFL
jgi:hypothetical protein